MTKQGSRFVTHASSNRTRWSRAGGKQAGPSRACYEVAWSWSGQTAERAAQVLSGYRSQSGRQAALSAALSLPGARNAAMPAQNSDSAATSVSSAST
jgi:hypothetical protein